jgi:hypothetical protein
MISISQSYLDNATDEELLERIQTFANEIDGNLDDSDFSYDYLGDLCACADELRERMYQRQYGEAEVS